MAGLCQALPELFHIGLQRRIFVYLVLLEDDLVLLPAEGNLLLFGHQDEIGISGHRVGGAPRQGRQQDEEAGETGQAGCAGCGCGCGCSEHGMVWCIWQVDGDMILQFNPGAPGCRVRRTAIAAPGTRRQPGRDRSRSREQAPPNATASQHFHERNQYSGYRQHRPGRRDALERPGPWRQPFPAACFPVRPRTPWMCRRSRGLDTPSLVWFDGEEIAGALPLFEKHNSWGSSYSTTPGHTPMNATAFLLPQTG